MALPLHPMLLTALRNLIARKTPSASSVRGRPPKTTELAQGFLRSLSLERFGTSDQAEYRRQLNAATRRLAIKLPGQNNWGLARKLLNMFLRDCCYNAYLRSAYRLGRAERFMEVPLDSLTIEAIAKRTGLPRISLRQLDSVRSEEYQRAARDWAGGLKLRPLHLDALVFGERAKWK